MSPKHASVRTIGLVILIVTSVMLVSALSGLPTAAFQDTTTTPTATNPPPTVLPTNTPRPTATATDPAPTLVAPTPMPTLTPTPYTPPDTSGLTVAQGVGRLRVGTYYNAEPFSWLDQYGAVDGYEPDIIQAIAIELGIEVEFVQVTRQNALDMLLGERIDLLIGQQAHTRDREDLLDFSHPYYVNEEKVVVLTDAPFNALADLTGQPVAVAIGTRSERALRNWSALNGVTLDIRTYFTESAALDALEAGDVMAMVGELHSLRNAGRQGMRFIDQPILVEYYAVTMRRWDVNMRNIINRSLQRLKASGRLDQIFEEWFPNEAANFNVLVPVYEQLYEDTRALGDFPNDMPYPANPTIDRINSGQPLRVAGVAPVGEAAPAQVRIMNAFNQALVEEMARRWGVQVQIIPNSTTNAANLIAAGQADIAVGISPQWNPAILVDYSQPYLSHGDRLLVPTNAIINTFADMLGTGWLIGYFADKPADADNIRKFAEVFGVGQNVRDPVALQNEDNALPTMVDQANLDAIFGDNLRLLALQQNGYENQTKLLTTPYGDDRPLTFAVPRNDADFRALVNETLQDMAQDGTYQRLWGELFGQGDPLPIEIWPPISPDVTLPD